MSEILRSLSRTIFAPRILFLHSVAIWNLKGLEMLPFILFTFLSLCYFKYPLRKEILNWFRHLWRSDLSAHGNHSDVCQIDEKAEQYMPSQLSPSPCCLCLERTAFHICFTLLSELRWVLFVLISLFFPKLQMFISELLPFFILDIEESFGFLCEHHETGFKDLPQQKSNPQLFHLEVVCLELLVTPLTRKVKGWKC